MMNGHSPETALAPFQRKAVPPIGKRDEKAEAKREAGRLRVLTMADCAAAAPRGYIVKGLIAPADLAVLFGPPGAGKSVVAPYLAHAVAAGRSVFGRRVRQGVVLYIAAEDGSGMKLRAKALRQLCGDAAGLRIVVQPVNLMGDGSADTADLGELRAIARRLGAVLIVLDTLAAAFPGVDENDGRSMGWVVKVLRDLGAPAEAEGEAPAWSGAAVVAVHHAAKGGGTTPRGHGVLDGAADVTMRIEVSEDRTAPRTVKLGKNRNGSSLDGFAFTIRAETLGEDEDGDRITAPVAEEAEIESGRAGGAKALTPQQRTALRMLVDVAQTEGVALPAAWQMPADLRAVPIERWAAECEARHLSASPEARSRKQIFKRAAEDLRNRVAVAMREGLVWATGA